jgi:hypothetical protein
VTGYLYGCVHEQFGECDAGGICGIFIVCTACPFFVCPYLIVIAFQFVFNNLNFVFVDISGTYDTKATCIRR